ncbi:hypothetical protein HDU97_005364 [Phlyctochytrium planicorne]|nr:hypothetical protein HDU97_005364 [Phlyctochytrium planicorne]
MSDFQAIASQFIQFYYEKFDSDRSQLLPLYNEHSMLSYEGQTFMGAKNIVEKLTSLAFQRISHSVTTFDAQPSHPQQGSILITVMGQLKIDDEAHALQFVQTFNLYPSPAGGYFVYNDIFRLVAAAFIPSSTNSANNANGATKPLQLWQILLLTCSLGGIQFAWTVEFAYGSPYLNSLGMTKPLLALVWLAGPLSGLLIQPIVGVYSDRCTWSIGRRRPFLIGGALMMIASVSMIAYSKELAGLLSSNDEYHSSFTIFFAVMGFYILDFSINTVTTSSRALIVDNVPLHQQDIASVWASRMSGLGNVVGYFTGTVDLTWFFDGVAKAHPILFGTQLKILCFISNIFLVVCLLLTCLSVKEKKLDKDTTQRRARWYEPLLGIVKALRRLPAPLQAICNVQFFAWLGWFPFLFYVSSWVGEKIPDSDPPNKEGDASVRERAGAFALLLKALLSLVASAVLPLLTLRSAPHTRGNRLEYFVRKARTLPGVWAVGLGMFGFLCISTFVSTSVASAITIVALCGVSWGVVQWVPFSLIAEYVALYSEAPPTGDEGDPSITDEDGGGRSYQHVPDEEEDGADALSEGSQRPIRPTSSPSHLSAGIILGIHNIYIVVPQFISTLVTSLIFKIVDAVAEKDDETGSYDPKLDAYGWCLRVGAIATLISACMAWNVREARRR